MGSWKLPSNWGSLREGDPNSPDAAFHAGHINDVLRLNTAPYFPMLVASDSSGVWLVNEFGGIAFPLSWEWNDTHFNCLAAGFYSDQHVYAAGNALYETDTTTPLPLLQWRRIPVLFPGEHRQLNGQIFRIIVVRERRKIVLATEEGVFWADIPAPGGNYVFKQATSLPGTRFSGLAEGLDTSVVVGAWGSDLNTHFGIFVGAWAGPSNGLIFQRAAIKGKINARQMLRTELTSCVTDRSRLYAVCGGGGGLTVQRDAANNPVTDGFGNVQWVGDELIYRVLASTDGGLSWNVTGNDIPGSSEKLFNGPNDVLGHTQGGYNISIGVSPFDPNLLAVGIGGPAISRNAGKDWELLSSSHLHADIHGLYFDQTDPARIRLYICSDGGLASTPDLGKTYSSGANRQFPNFQFGRFAASFQNSGLIGGSLQDNGDVYTMLYVNSDPWKDLDGGDGILMMFPQSGHLVRYNNTLVSSGGGVDVEYGNKTRIASWDDGKRSFSDLKLFPSAPLSWGVIPVDATGDGLSIPITEVVNLPDWKDTNGQPMLAVAATGETVYGLFGNGGGGFMWNKLTVVPHEPDKDSNGNELPYAITAIASFDGNEIFVGMNNGRIFRLDAPDWLPKDLTISGNKQGINRFSVAKNSPQFAITVSHIFRLDGTGWTDVTPTTPAPIGGLTALTSDQNSPKRQLFLASSSQLWSSEDHGVTWFDFGGGLPKQPQITDLRFVTEFSGASFLYLSTWGWSVFRWLLNFDEVLKTVTISGHMDIVDRVAFGHDEWAHPSIFNVLQLGPLHPLEEVEYTEDDGDEIQVQLKLRFEWHIDFSVVVKYDATLLAKDEDEDENPNDHQSGSFTVPFSSNVQQVVDLASDELWPDRAHIEINVANP